MPVKIPDRLVVLIYGKSKAIADGKLAVGGLLVVVLILIAIGAFSDQKRASRSTTLRKPTRLWSRIVLILIAIGVL